MTSKSQRSWSSVRSSSIRAAGIAFQRCPVTSGEQQNVQGSGHPKLEKYEIPTWCRGSWNALGRGRRSTRRPLRSVSCARRYASKSRSSHGQLSSSPQPTTCRWAV